MAALIAWSNLADQAVLSIETGGIDPNHPLANLKLRGLAAEMMSLPAGPGAPLRLLADMTQLPFDWLDAAFDAGVGDGSINAIALQPDGKIIIGGTFTIVGGQAIHRLARLNANGTVDDDFVAVVNAGINAIALQPDGKIIIGGAFTAVNGSTRNRIARLNANGTIDATFNPNANNNVLSLALQPDGKIIIGGDFTIVGGQAIHRLARLNANGTVDDDFLISGVDGYVSAIALQPDGKIIIGGAFTTVNSLDRNNFAVLFANGAIDRRFHPPFSGSVQAIAVQSDGQFLAGGFFTSPRRYLMRLLPDTPDKIRVVAMLGMWDGYAGTAVVSYRPAPGDAWVVMGHANASVERLSTRFLAGHLVVLLPTPVPAAGQFRIEFTGSEATPVRFGRLWIGDALSLPDGIDAGWSMGFRDSGSLDPTDGQQWIESPGVRTRVLTIPLEGARETETAWGFADGASSITNRMSLHALQMECGTTGEVIAVARTGTALWTRHSAVYGHIDSPWAIGHHAGPYWGGSLTVVEER